jgi:hypothetical protein
VISFLSAGSDEEGKKRSRVSLRESSPDETAVMQIAAVTIGFVSEAKSKCVCFERGSPFSDVVPQVHSKRILSGLAKRKLAPEKILSSIA